MTMNRPRKKRKMVPIYAMEDIFAHKKNPKKVSGLAARLEAMQKQVEEMQQQRKK